MTTLAGSITRDGCTWRLQGKSGAVYVWRNAHGLACSCPKFRQGKDKRCPHIRTVVAHLTAALAEYAKDGD
jgi:hypothetical protein